MRADARIVTGKRVAEKAVATDVVCLDANEASLDSFRDVPLEGSGRPAAVMGLKQQIAVTRGRCQTNSRAVFDRVSFRP